MSVPIAYVTIIVIWSITPLGIKWSSEDVGYEFGVTSRMVIGLFILLIWMRVRRIAFPWHREAIRVYLVSGLSMFAAMASVYWSAQFIPSGWISVVFGISPIITGILAYMILQDNGFTEGRLLGLLLGLLGLCVIFLEGMDISKAAILGIAGVLFSATAQPLGAVMLKKYQPTMHAIAITCGSLIIALPLFIINWLMFGPELPAEISSRAIGAILFLAVFGTGIGFPLYYYVLKHLSAGHVSLITLITPVTALLMGNVFNSESISNRVWFGTLLIMFGLLIHERKKLSRLWSS